MWLFGQLNTGGDSEVKQQTDSNAKLVASLLRQLAETQQSAPMDIKPTADSVDNAADYADHS